MASAAPAEDSQTAAPPSDEARAQDVAKLRDYFRWRPLPWWVCYMIGIFMLTKLQLVYNDSPCAVLGTPSPVNSSDVKRAFRTVSMCTHPDRLRGRLKRSPTSTESRRGEILFNRASVAKDELQREIRRSGSAPCYQGELELSLLALFAQLGSSLGQLGLYDYFEFLSGFGWGLITFKSGVLNTLLSLLWLGFLWRVAKQFLVYLWRMGILRGILALVTSVVIGPLPTLVNFLILPVLRVAAFARELIPKNDDGGPEPIAAETVAPPTSANSRAREDVPRNLRQRKKKPTEEETEKRNNALLSGEASSSTGGPTRIPNGIWECVTWTNSEPVKARLVAASAVQFELVLLLTKPIVPLIMLIALGEVWNGLIVSLVVGYVLRRWVPQMSHEGHHLLCALFGVVHTLLGVSAAEVEDHANREGAHMLHLRWSWSFKDVLSITHMCLLGSTVTSVTTLGNEPSFAASFGAGIAVRILLAQDTVRGVPLVSFLGEKLEASLKNVGVVLDRADEVVAYSGFGIGDCAGGPFRMLFGDGPSAAWAAFLVKIWLGLLPALAALHWFHRSVQAGRMIGKKFKMLRFVQRLVLCTLTCAQCILLVSSELNASSGPLNNFWVAMLFGCVIESLLCTFDVRGTVRHLMFLMLFVLI